LNAAIAAAMAVVVSPWTITRPGDARQDLVHAARRAAVLAFRLWPADERQVNLGLEIKLCRT